MLNFANNAKAEILGTVLTGSGFLTVKWGKGDLFPSVFPYKCTALKKNTSNAVTQREIITVTWRTGDTFTITKWAEACPASDTATTATINDFQFDDWDEFFLWVTAGRQDEINTELDLKLNISTYNAEKNVYGASSTGNDAYQIADASITAYSETRTYRVKADVTNTGACTFEINSLGAKPVRKQQGTVDLADWDWQANGIATLVYNATLDVFQFSWQEAVFAVVSPESTESEFTAGENLTTGDPVYVDNATGNVFKTDIDDAGKRSFIGFVKSGVTSWNPVNITTSGINGNQTGLTRDNIYYLSRGAFSTNQTIEQLLENISSNSNTSVIFGYSTTYVFRKQTFTISQSGFLNDITVQLRKIGTPTGSVRMSLWQSWPSKTSTSGETLLGYATNDIDLATITGTFATYQFNFDWIELTNTASEEYFFRVESTATLSTSNYPVIACQNSNVYAGGSNYDLGDPDTTYTNRNNDLYFDISVWSYATGGISNTPWNPQIAVGRAVSTTGILINTNDKYNSDTYSALDFDNQTAVRAINASSSVETYTHNLWRIPKFIKVDAKWGWGTSSMASCTWTYINGSFSGIRTTANWIGGQEVVWISILDSSNEGQSGVIQNVTDTDFQIDWSLVNTPSLWNDIALNFFIW